MPDAEIYGFGGPRLRHAGGTLLGDFSRFSVTGLSESIAIMPRAAMMLWRLISAARRNPPDVFIPIDFPDFNFYLVAALRRLRIPIVYYVSPQLWAWRPGRMKAMKAGVKRVLVIFPFEERIYQDAGVDVRFVGHPLVELVAATEPRATFLASLGLDPIAPTVALLPGSRHNEVAQTIPMYAAALALIRARVPNVQFIVACAPSIEDAEFAPLRAATGGVPHVLVR